MYVSLCKTALLNLIMDHYAADLILRFSSWVHHVHIRLWCTLSQVLSATSLVLTASTTALLTNRNGLSVPLDPSATLRGGTWFMVNILPFIPCCPGLILSYLQKGGIKSMMTGGGLSDLNYYLTIHSDYLPRFYPRSLRIPSPNLLTISASLSLSTLEFVLRRLTNVIRKYNLSPHEQYLQNMIHIKWVKACFDDFYY